MMKTLGRHCKKIQFRLLSLFACLSLLPLLGVGIIAFQSGRASLQQAIGAQLELRAERVLDITGRLFADGQQSIQSWAKLSVMYDLIGEDPDGRITRTLITLARQSSSIGDVLAVSRQGIVVAVSRPSRIGEKVAEQSWFRRVQAQDPFVERRVESMSALEGGHFYFFAPVLSQAKQQGLIGYLVATLPIEELAEALVMSGSNVTGQSREIYVKNEQGQLIITPSLLQRRPMTGLETNRFAHADRVHQSSKSGNGWMVWQAEDHVELLAGLFVAPSGPLKGTMAVVMEDAHDALAPVHDLRIKIAVIGLCLVCGLLFLSHVLAKRLSRPIKDLIICAESVASGHFITTSLPLEREDEIGSLARAFQRMTGELKKLTEDLEARVRARTISLDQTNRCLKEQIREREAAESATKASEERYH